MNSHLTFPLAFAFVLASNPVRADWTPSEGSVTRPAVVTLDAFADAGAPGGKGIHPIGPLVVASDGNLYGSTVSGGTNFSAPFTSGFGTLFRFTTAGVFTKLQDLGDAEGHPSALVPGPNGTLVCLAMHGVIRDSEDG